MCAIRHKSRWGSSIANDYCIMIMANGADDDDGAWVGVVVVLMMIMAITIFLGPFLLFEGERFFLFWFCSSFWCISNIANTINTTTSVKVYFCLPPVGNRHDFPDGNLCLLSSRTSVVIQMRPQAHSVENCRCVCVCVGSQISRQAKQCRSCALWVVLMVCLALIRLFTSESGSITTIGDCSTTKKTILGQQRRQRTHLFIMRGLHTVWWEVNLSGWLFVR